MSGREPINPPLLVALSLALLTTASCVHIRLNTAIAADGGTLRSLDLSVDEKYRPLLKKAQKTDGQMFSAQGSVDGEELCPGRTLPSSPHEGIPGCRRHIRPRAAALFGQWIELGAYQEGDAVDFDIYRTLPATSYAFRETFNIRPSAAALTETRQQSLPPVEVQIAVEMPGQLLESPSATRTDGRTATWNFSIAIEDTTSFAEQVTVRSGRTHFWHYLFAGTLVILFLVSLPGQFRR